MRTDLDHAPDVAGRRERLINLCCSFPEAEAERAGATHFAFKVRKKTFAYYAFNHHGDGVIALWCKAAAGEQDRLAQEHPTRYFVPPYLGSKGWIALRLDTARVDWKEIEKLASVSYVLVAPTGLAKAMGPADPSKSGRSKSRASKGLKPRAK